MELFDKVRIEVKTTFGVILVEFTIISVINEYAQIYALIAQDRICIGQYMVNDAWELSENIDLLNINTIPRVYHDNIIVSDSELNALENQSPEC